VASIVAAGLLPAAMEIMDRLAIEAAEAAVHVGYPHDAPAVLIVELDGEALQVEEEFGRLQEVMEASGADEIRVAADEAERATIWKGRKSAFSAVGRLSPDYLVNDGVVPRTRLAEALAEIGRLAAARGLRVANVFHAGDGNLHPLVLYDGSGDSGGRDRRPLHPARGLDHRGTRRGHGETGVPASPLRSGRHGRPARPPRRHRPGGAVEPRQGLPRMSGHGEVRPTSVEDVQAAVQEHARVLPVGGGSKTALSTPPDGFVPVHLSGLTGVVEYDPGELVLTALAGTSVAEIGDVLGEHGLYLPFDPPFVERGATLGGTVASGLSGPGRCRHGGVRDFVLGVRFVSAAGELVRGRGRVVKNAAGFDLPKLFVGSLGQLGVLVELSVKVLPAPEAHVSLALDRDSAAEAVAVITRISALPLDVDALDVDVRPEGVRVLLRLGGLAAALPARVERLQGELGGTVVRGAEDDALWRDAREFAWVPPGWTLVKVPLTPSRIGELESSLPEGASHRRYSGLGHVAWIALEGSAEALASPLERLGLAGLVVLGDASRRLGTRPGAVFERRVRMALDPSGRFVEV
jgi:glycolate oxidase FAD binding subunit